MKIITPNRLISTQEMAEEGLHDAIWNLVLAEQLSLDSRVLVVGAGKGAFEQRLLAAGFSRVTSVDIDPCGYDQTLTTRFVCADLDEPWTWGDEYDLVIALEVIEHLANVRHFTEQLSQHLADGGTCILSTPNICDSASVASLVLTGRHLSFDQNALAWGHVSPILHHVLKQYLGQCGLEIAREAFILNFFSRLVVYSWKSIPYCALLWIISVAISIVGMRRKSTRGRIWVLIARHKSQRPEKIPA